MSTTRDEEETFLKETEAFHNLRAMEEIEKNPNISQRELSTHLGVALGITNSMLKTLVRKGLLKIRGENNRSLTYHLTHAGVLAKSALAIKWTLNTIDFYRQARLDVVERLTAVAGDGCKSVVLYGFGELAEIAVIVAGEVGLETRGLIDEAPEGRALLNLPVGGVELIEEVHPDAVVVCVEDADAEQILRARELVDGKVYFLMGQAHQSGTEVVLP